MNPITFFRHPSDEHYIDQGHVFCPVRERDVDFDLCAGCRWATDIDLTSRLPVVRCRPTRFPSWLGRPWL
jgi:hypothetical protein